MGSSRWDKRDEGLRCLQRGTCNEGLATTSAETDVRFISYLSPFDRILGLVGGKKVGQSHLKSHLDPEARVLQSGLNAMELCAASNKGLATT